MTFGQAVIPDLFVLVVTFFANRYVLQVLARQRVRLEKGEARAFWQGVCAERAAHHDEVARLLHEQALRACQNQDPMGHGPRGGRAIGSVHEEVAWNNECKARALREDAKR